MPTQEETTTPAPVVEVASTPAAPVVETAPTSAASTGTDTQPPTPSAPVDLEDLEWDGEADVSSLPHAQKFPKLFGSLKSRVEQLRAKKEEDDLLERFLNDGDPAVKKELEELRAFQKEVQEDRKAEAFEAELKAKLPQDIFENDEALEMYLNRVHDKGLDEDEALVLVQAKFAGKKPRAEVQAEVEEEAEEVEAPAEADEETPAPAPSPAPPRTPKVLPPSVLAAKKPASAPPTQRGFDTVDDVWKQWGL